MMTCTLAVQRVADSLQTSPALCLYTRYVATQKIPCHHEIYKLYFAMTAANNKTHTVKGKEKKRKKKTHNIQ